MSGPGDPRVEVSPEDTTDARPVQRGVGLGVLVGLAVALVVVAIGFSVVAIPLFALARFVDPGGGLDHPFIRTGLLRWALPIGLFFGLVTGTAAGLWYALGGRLPRADGDHPGAIR